MQMQRKGPPAWSRKQYHCRFSVSCIFSVSLSCKQSDCCVLFWCAGNKWFAETEEIQELKWSSKELQELKKKTCIVDFNLKESNFESRISAQETKNTVTSDLSFAWTHLVQFMKLTWTQSVYSTMPHKSERAWYWMMKEIITVLLRVHYSAEGARARTRARTQVQWGNEGKGRRRRMLRSHDHTLRSRRSRLHMVNLL